MKKYGFLLIFVVSIMAGCVHSPSHRDADHKHSDIVAGRLLISDDAGRVHIYSLAEGKVLNSFALGFVPSAVYSTAGKGVGVVLGRNENRTAFIDGGFILEDHGDHLHPSLNPPTVLAQQFTYGKPTHYQTTEVASTIFFDGRGSAGNPIDVFEEEARVAVIREDELRSGTLPSVIRLKNNVHGSAEIRGNFLITAARVYQEKSPLADRLQLFEWRSSGYEYVKTFEVDATGLHGSATSGMYTVFAAKDSLIVITQENGNFTAAALPYPKSMQNIVCPDKKGNQQAVRIGSFAHHFNSPVFIGNACHHLFTVNPKTKKVAEIRWKGHETAQVVKYTFDKNGRHLIFLDKEGFLHIADAENNFKTVADIRIFPDGLQTKGHGGPRIVCNGNTNEVYVVNQEKKCITVVNLQQGKIIREITNEFIPTDAAWLGIEGVESLNYSSCSH